jgi:hypothetical protein
MSIRNNHWYNINEQQSYPLDDTASAVADNGSRLPSALIADLRLRWPVEYGEYAFISSAAVTNHIVTVMIEASQSMTNNPSTSVLIAGISIAKSELVEGRTYNLDTFKPGVGGFIVFGAGAFQADYTGLFSSPLQGLLTARAARASRAPAVPFIQIEGVAQTLTGMVNLSAVAPLVLSKQTKVINGDTYDNVVVFGLADTGGSVVGTNNTSVFSQFAGPCGRRVGSKSCADPQPILSLNSVTPDCDGVLTLEFSGCAVVGRNNTDCGVIVDCGLGLADACLPKYLPKLTTGELPSEVAPADIPSVTDPTDGSPTDPPPIIDETVTVTMGLPHCQDFSQNRSSGFIPTSGSLFGFIADDSPQQPICSEVLTYTSYGAISDAAQAKTNISIFDLDAQCLYRRYHTDVKILNGLAGSRKNAGILMNYKSSTSGLVTYLLALLDIAAGTFGIYFFNGVGLVTISQAAVSGLYVGNWYRVSFQALPNTSTYTSVNLVAVLTGVEDSVNLTISSSVSSNLWVADSARSGLYIDRSKSYFSYWSIDEVTS